VRNDGDCGCRWLYENRKSPENNPENAINQQPTENQNNTKPKYKLSGGPGFTFSLTGGAIRPSAPLKLRHWL